MASRVKESPREVQVREKPVSHFADGLAERPTGLSVESKGAIVTEEITRTSITLSVADAAGYVGVSTKTIYRAIESRRLKHACVGQSKCFRIRPEWLDDWINECAVEPERAVSEVAIKRAVTPPRTARRGPYAQAQTPRRGILK